MLNNTYRKRMEKRIKMKKFMMDCLFYGAIGIVIWTILFCLIKLTFG